MDTKYCNGCLQTKSILEFNKRNDRANGRQTKCRTCQHKQGKSWRLKHVTILKDKWLRFRYNLSLEERDIKIKEQNLACLICLTPFNEMVYPCVDHNHQTNEVRGILCQNCNALLGMAKDDPIILKSALAYLERTNAS